jgi:hypothetical protein
MGPGFFSLKALPITVLMTFKFSPINNMGTLPLLLVYSETKVSMVY